MVSDELDLENLKALSWAEVIVEDEVKKERRAFNKLEPPRASDSVYECGCLIHSKGKRR